MNIFDTPYKFAHSSFPLNVQAGETVRINNTHGLFVDAPSPIVLSPPKSGLKRVRYLLNIIMHLAASNIKISCPDGGEIDFREEDDSLSLSCSGRLFLQRERTDIHTRLTDLFRMMAFAEIKEITLRPDQKLVVYGLSNDENAEQIESRSPPGYKGRLIAPATECVEVTYQGMRRLRAVQLSSPTGPRIQQVPLPLYPLPELFRARMLFKPTIPASYFPVGWAVDGLNTLENLSIPFVLDNKVIALFGRELRLIDAEVITVDVSTIPRMMFENRRQKFTIPAETALKIVGIVGDLKSQIFNRSPRGYRTDIYTRRDPVTQGDDLFYPAGSQITFTLTPLSLKEVTKQLIQAAKPILLSELQEGDINSYIQMLYHILYEFTLKRIGSWKYFPPELLTSFSFETVGKLIKVEERILSAYAAILSEISFVKKFSEIFKMTPEEFSEIETDSLPGPVQTLHKYLLNLANSELQSPYLKDTLSAVLQELTID